MKIDFEKVGIISAYFAENTEGLYVTKLLKLFYYLDFAAYNLRGAPVTNDIYYKLPYGPVPTAIKNEIDLLSADGIMGKEFKSQFSKYIELVRDEHDNGNLIKLKKKDYNLKKLSKNELHLVKVVSDRFKTTRAKVLSNQTHREKPWLQTSDNSVIDYELSNDLDIKKIFPDFIDKK